MELLKGSTTAKRILQSQKAREAHSTPATMAPAAEQPLMPPGVVPDNGTLPIGPTEPIFGRGLGGQ